MDTKQILVNDLLLRYSVAGRGRSILLLHGWGDSLATFHELAQKLSTDYQVVCLDLPGFGHSQTPSLAWGLEEYARLVREFIRKTELTNLFALIGHSNGGALAVRLVANAYCQPERLVLLASSGVRNRQNIRKQALKAGVKTAKILTVALPKATKQRLRNKLYGVIGSDYLVVPHMKETFKKIVAEDVTGLAKQIQVPTLLIYGTDDTATPLAHGKTLSAAIAGSQLHIMPGVGHFVHHDKPAEVHKLISEFLK